MSDLNRSNPGLVDRLLGSPLNETHRDARTVAGALIFALLIGTLLAIFWQPSHWPGALMWASASTMVGMLLGFLFGIPRFIARAGAPTPASNPQPPAANAPQGDSSQQADPGDNAQGGVNTNLEEISDWLTKIIVGVSLVEVRRAQSVLQAAAAFVAQTLGGPSGTSFAYALMVYFSICGFLGSYLITRLYLQEAFRDAAKP